MSEVKKKVLIAVGNGTEDVEAVVHIDLIRRAGAEVIVCKVDGKSKTDLICTCSNKTKIVADTHILSIDFEKEKDSFDLIFVPGGMGGSKACRDSEQLIKLMKYQNAKKKWIGAICAAPVIVLQTHGFLKEKKEVTSYPSLQSKLEGDVDKKIAKEKKVCVDGNIVTSQAPGTSFISALKHIELLFGKKKSEEIAKACVVSI